jgi:GTP-binding protein
MRFIDEAKISLSAGHGGPGSVSFRREKFIPRGGPDGGDGGAGGDITFIATSQLSTLQDFRFKREYKAENGLHGSGANKSGRDGKSVEIRIPVGTIIRDTETSEILHDFVTEGETWLACEGGRGGKGNAHFVSSTFQAPKFAQDGEAGSFRDLTLELKLLADAAIIGFPNAGKSTLISRMSAARPKIADYPFTTLTPNLGVVDLNEVGKSFVIADIPGLIEGAHAGLGLGTKFLKHIERTAIFVHLLDGTQLLDDATKPDEDSFQQAIKAIAKRYESIRNELGLFNEELLKKPEIVVLNKLDLLESDPELIEKSRKELRKAIKKLRADSPPREAEPMVISAVSGRGVQEVIMAVYTEVEKDRERRRQEAGGVEATPKKYRMPDDETIQF